MLEPISGLLAGFGVTMTLVGAAANTWQQCRQRLVDYQDASFTLDGVAADIENCSLKVRECFDDWQIQPGIEDNCIELFSKEEVDRFRRRVTQTGIALAKVQKQVRCFFERSVKAKQDDPATVAAGQQTTDLDIAYRESLKWMVNYDKKIPAAPERMISSSTRTPFHLRLKLAIDNGSLVERRVKVLQNQVQCLREYSDYLARQLPDLNLDGRSLSPRDRVEQLDALDKRWKQFSDVMTALADCSACPELLARQPDEQGKPHCLGQESEDVVATLLVPQEEAQVQPIRIVQVDAARASRLDSKTRVQQILRGLCQSRSSDDNMPCAQVKGKRMRQVYQTVARLDQQYQQMIHRLWEKERVDAAIAIMNWTLLLWNTPWSVCICSYRLWRYHTPQDRRTQISFRRTECSGEHQLTCSTAADSVYSIAEGRILKKNKARRKPTSEQTVKAAQTMFSLAVTLCEIALVCPITVECLEGGQMRFVCRYQLELRMEEDELLDRVDDVLGRQYRLAPQACFEWARSSAHQPCSAADLIIFWDKVVKQLALYKERVTNEREKNQEKRYAKLPAPLALELSSDFNDGS